MKILYFITKSNWGGAQKYVFDLAEKRFKLNAGEDEKEPGGLYHSGMFALIDKEGKIRSRKDSFGNPIYFYDGLEEAGTKAIKEDIKKLLEEQISDFQTTDFRLVLSIKTK